MRLVVCEVEESFGFFHPHPSRFACLPTPSGLRPSPPDRGSRPSPARGEGLSVRLSRLLCSPVSASFRSLPPHGGRWLAEGQTDEGEAEGLLLLYKLQVTFTMCHFKEIFVLK